MVVAEIFSPDILIVLVVIAVLFGGAKLPKLARSLGSAKGEFEKGLREGAAASDDAKPEPKPADPKAIEASPESTVDTTGTVARDETTS